MILKGNSFKKMPFKMDETIYKCSLRFWEVDEKTIQSFEDKNYWRRDYYKRMPEFMFFIITRDQYGDYFAREVNTNLVFPIVYYDGRKLRCSRIRTVIYYAINFSDIAQASQEEIECYITSKDLKKYHDMNQYKELPSFPIKEENQIIETPIEVASISQSKQIELATKTSYPIDPFFTEYGIIQELLTDVKKHDENEYQKFSRILEAILVEEKAAYQISNDTLQLGSYLTAQNNCFIDMCKLEYEIQSYIKEHFNEIALIKLYAYFDKLDAKEFDFKGFTCMMSIAAQFFVETKLEIPFFEKRKLVIAINQCYKRVMEKYPSSTNTILGTEEYSYFSGMYQIIQGNTSEIINQTTNPAEQPKLKAYGDVTRLFNK